MKTRLHRGDRSPDLKLVPWSEKDVARARATFKARRIYVDRRDPQCLVIEARRLYGPAHITRFIPEVQMLALALRTSFGFSWNLGRPRSKKREIA